MCIESSLDTHVHVVIYNLSHVCFFFLSIRAHDAQKGFSFLANACRIGLRLILGLHVIGDRMIHGMREKTK